MFVTRPPSPSLAAHVAFLWYADVAARDAGAVERVLPDGAMQIVISLRDRPMRVFDRRDPSRYVDAPSAIVTGPSAEFSVISAADTSSTVGVSFKAGGAVPFIGVPSTVHGPQTTDHSPTGLRCTGLACRSPPRPRASRGGSRAGKFYKTRPLDPRDPARVPGGARP